VRPKLEEGSARADRKPQKALGHYSHARFTLGSALLGVGCCAVQYASPRKAIIPLSPRDLESSEAWICSAVPADSCARLSRLFARVRRTSVHSGKHRHYQLVNTNIASYNAAQRLLELSVIVLSCLSLRKSNSW